MDYVFYGNWSQKICLSLHFLSNASQEFANLKKLTMKFENSQANASHRKLLVKRGTSPHKLNLRWVAFSVDQAFSWKISTVLTPGLCRVHWLNKRMCTSYLDSLLVSSCRGTGSNRSTNICRHASPRSYDLGWYPATSELWFICC